MSSEHKNSSAAGLALRLLVIPVTTASLWLMAINKQNSEDYGNVEFKNLSGLRYLVSVNSIALGYAVVSALLTSLASSFNSDWLLFIFDQIVAYLMVTSASAVTELLYLARAGNQAVSWSEVCSYYSKFCYGIKVSLILQFVSCFFFIVLSIFSAYLLFSKFEAPSVSSSKEVEQQEL